MLKTYIKKIQRSTINSKQSKMLLDMGNSGGEKRSHEREKERGRRREEREKRIGQEKMGRIGQLCSGERFFPARNK
jgi:hypothetical protein